MLKKSIKPDWSQKGAYWFDLWDHTPRDELYGCIEPPSLGTPLSDEAAMFYACTVALKGAGNVSPNPLVGAVIVDREGRYLGAGSHLKLGEAHAEVRAWESVPESDVTEGGTIFVTLEPCSHFGRTPPCAQMLAKTKLARVVYGVMDPNPKVNGQGRAILEAAGKTVQCLSAWTSRCEWLARVFIHNQRTGSVFTALKVASTSDGVIAGDQTKRLWITGERARAMGHFLRLEYDAIVIGIGTLTLDNPTLNIRHPWLAGRTPLRVVLDPRNDLDNSRTHFKLFEEEPHRTLVIVPSGSSELCNLQRLGVKSIRLPLNSSGQFEWSTIKKSLWGLDIRSLLIEGGAGLYRSALTAKAVDVIHWFVAPEANDVGLTWPLEERFSQAYTQGLGVRLDQDRLLDLII